MSQPEALSKRSDDIFEALGTKVNDTFETLSALLDKAWLELLMFGNLLSIILRGAVITHNQIMFSILLIVHMICYRYFHSPGQSHSSKPSTSSTTDREP